MDEENSCPWRIANYREKTAVCIDLILSATFPFLFCSVMKDLLMLIAHLLTTITRRCRGRARVGMIVLQVVTWVNRSIHDTLVMDHEFRLKRVYTAVRLANNAPMPAAAIIMPPARFTTRKMPVVRTRRRSRSVPIAHAVSLSMPMNTNVTTRKAA